MSENNSNFAVDYIYNMTKKQREDIINAIATTAKKLTPKGSQIILFGSQARGDARDDSDWDVLILLEKPRINLEDIDNVSYPLRELGGNMVKISILCYIQKKIGIIIHLLHFIKT